MKSDLGGLRKKIYENLKKRAYALEGEISQELKTYRKDQIKAAKRPFFPSTIDELKASVLESQVIYLGDFHTFDQNIRNVLRVLKVLVAGKADCMIGLEMVDAKHQICLDAFLEGHLTELEFLESIYYHNSWRFPWTHYKLIFELAKENNLKMLALNTKGKLPERDDFAAEKISSHLKDRPNMKILVVYGELHISPDKIPARVAGLSPGAVQTVIHQNLDEVYWKMEEDSQSDKIVKFNGREYCVNSAPPWVKYESMIYWYENLNNDPDFDIHEYIIENGKKIFSEDTRENFLAICQEMAAAAQIDLERAGLEEDDLEDFNLRDHTGLEFTQEKIEELDDQTLKNFYKNLIASGQSFRLPGERSFYCSSYSMNRISYLAGSHIFHLFAEASLDKEQARSLNKDRSKFCALFALEAMHAFFFSKIMNPHRKCDMYWNLEQEFAQEGLKFKKNALGAALKLLDGAGFDEALFSLNLTEIHQAAQMVGHILGEYLYSKIFLLGKELALLSETIIMPVSPETFKVVRERLLQGLDYQRHKKRYF